MTKENIKDMFSAERRVTNLLNNIQSVSPIELNSETVRNIMCAYFKATQDLLNLIGEAKDEQIPREEFGAALDNLYKECDRFFEEMKDAVLKHMIKTDGVKN